MRTKVDKQKLAETKAEIRERQRKQDFLIGLCQKHGNLVKGFEIYDEDVWVKFKRNGVSTGVSEYAESKGFIVAGTYRDEDLGVTGVSFRELEFVPDEIVGKPDHE
jgi:hypothetical protein